MSGDWLARYGLALAIPFLSAFVGWFTNVIAVRMMFYPIRYVGLRPWLGWQGIVPANATALAAHSAQLITTRLLDLRSLMSDFDAGAFVDAHLGGALDRLTGLAGSGGGARSLPASAVRAELSRAATEIADDVAEQLDEILDLERIIVEAAQRDPRLVGELFQTTGRVELAFIERSGAYFGFAFGIAQAAAWLAYPAWWVLPLFGFFVGYATNWLALKLVFEPQHPRRVGPFVLHGLFHRRQTEVAREFARLVARDILSTDAMVAAMTSGEAGDRLLATIRPRLHAAVDRYAADPAVAAAVPEPIWGEMRQLIDVQLQDLLGRSDGPLAQLMSQAVDVRTTLFEALRQMDPASYEGVLRPAFEKDEWRLVLAGALLGLGAGGLQAALLVGGGA